MRGALIKTLVALIALFSIILLVAKLLRPKVEFLAHAFLERFGIYGMGVGSFIAEAFHFPVPPQFYMLTAITSGKPQGLPLLLICIGTVAGDIVALFVGRALSNVQSLRQRLEPSRHMVESMVGKHALLTALLAGASPVSFPTQCNIAGIYRLPWSFVMILLPLRIPRLLVFYFVIRAGWITAS